MRIGGSLVQKHQGELGRASQRNGGAVHEIADVQRTHPALDMRVHEAERFEGHVIGRLHQRQFRRRLDQTAGAHQGIGRDHVVGIRCSTQAVDDEEPRGGFHGQHARAGAPVAQTLNDSFDRALMLIPRPHVSAHLQRFAHRRFLECGRHHHHLTADGNDGESDPLGTAPPYSSEVVERRSRFDQKRRDLALAHERLNLGDACSSFFARDRLRVGSQGFEFRRGRYGRPIFRGHCDQGNAGGGAQKTASRQQIDRRRDGSGHDISLERNRRKHTAIEDKRDFETVICLRDSTGVLAMTARMRQ